MNADFHDAFERHNGDAETLFASSRWANADHLFGLATECGLKSLMLAFGMTWDTAKDRPLQGDDRVHVDGTWDRYEHYRAGHGAMKYLLSSPNPFLNWDVSQRYAAEANFAEAFVKPHKAACEEVGDLLNQAHLEGIIL